MDYYHKYIKYKAKYLSLKIRGEHNIPKNEISLSQMNDRKHAIFMFCILKDHYVLGACITAFVHKSMMKKQGIKNIDLVMMCDDYIYKKYKDTLEQYFDRVINIKLRYFEPANKYLYPKSKYSSWIGYSVNKWECLKYTEYDKILFLDIDIMVSSPKFYNVFTFDTPALYIVPHPGHACENSKQFKSYQGEMTYDSYIKNYEKYGTLNGGILLLEPNLNTYDEYVKMTNNLYKDGIYSTITSGPDETSLFYYFMSKKIPVYDICVDYVVVPWDDKQYVSVAKSYNFLSFVKPWTKPKFLSWEEEMIWRDVYDSMPHKGKVKDLFKDTIEESITQYKSYQDDKKRKYYNDYYIKKYRNEVSEIIESERKFEKIMELDRKITITRYGILKTDDITQVTNL